MQTMQRKKGGTGVLCTIAINTLEIIYVKDIAH